MHKVKDVRLTRTLAKHLAVALLAVACSSLPASEPTPADDTGVHSTSANFDSAWVEEYLLRLVPLTDGGFSRREAGEAAGRITSLQIDATWEDRFTVVFRGEPTRLSIQAYMDDVESPDLAFTASPRLIQAIEDEFDAFFGELGV